MILIQDGSQNTNVDKPLRIIGDPYKVQVRFVCCLFSLYLRLDACLHLLWDVVVVTVWLMHRSALL